MMKMNNKNSPPGILKYCLRKLAKNIEKRSIVGDFEEEYDEIIINNGKLHALVWYLFQIIISIPHFIKNSVYGSTAMFGNYIKIAIRNLLKYKIYSLINISGLALGLSVFILAAAYTCFNRSFDTFHENAENIYGIVQVLHSGNEGEQHNAQVPAPFIPAMVDEFPEVEDAVRFTRITRTIVKHENESFYENSIWYVDPNFLTFLTFNMISGDPYTALSKPNSIVLSKKTAIKYFGDEDPVGKSLTLNNEVDVIITGVVEDPPSNSSIQYDFLVSLETIRNFYGWMDDWHNMTSLGALIILPDNIDPGGVEDKFPGFVEKYYPDSFDTLKKVYLLPMTDFYQAIDAIDLRSEMMYQTPYVIVYFFIAMAIILLAVVCINFINLSTARYMNRAKEVGLRKVIGARRTQLIRQFLGESLIISIFALPVAILLYEFIRPGYISLVGYDMDLSIWSYPVLIIFLILFTLVVGLLSGIYPAFFLSSFKPVEIIKNKLIKGRKGFALKKILVVSQFVLSILLIVLSIAVKNQMSFLKESEFGHNRDNVLLVKIPSEARENTGLLKDSFLRHPDIEYVASSLNRPMKWWPQTQVVPEGIDRDDAWTMSWYGVGYDFIEAMEMSIIKGRSFSREHNEDNSFIINKMAADQLNWDNPIGKQITRGDQTGTVIGVVDDYLFYDAHFYMTPSVLYLNESPNYLLIKYSTDQPSEIQKYVTNQWENILTDLPIEQSLLTDDYLEGYNYIPIMSMVFAFIGGFAICISCLGLFGLASFTISRKIKEIGVRKVLGSSVNGIVKLLVSDFMALVLISNALAIPVSIFGLKLFLQWTWKYNTGVDYSYFVFASLITFLTAILAVIFQTMKAAYANPADSLRSE
ncbi:MAG: FtsX-like permease family protein [bacterium]|nr:FtsX-like permease family protein [bacterium]